MISKEIDIRTFQQMVSNHIREELQRAAEPIIQAALRELEARLRERLAGVLVGTIEHSYSLSQMGNILRIDVNLGGKS